MKIFKIFSEILSQGRVWRQVKAAEAKIQSPGAKPKVLFIFSRFHKDEKNIHFKAGSGLTQLKILGVLERLGYDVYFGGQEDFAYPKNYILESKAIIYLAPALPEFINYKPKGKLILWANNSHVLVRNARMRQSAEKWGLPVESLGPEQYFLPAYKISDHIMYSGNSDCVQTFLDNGVPGEKIVNWNNSTNTEVYKPAKEKFPKFTFVHWSSEIGLRKGLPAILAAWKKWNNPNARLILLGIVTKVGKQLLFSRTWYGKLLPNLPRNVELYGSQQGFPAQDPSVIETLGKSHVGLYPTLEDGQASAVIEMAACGLPMIVTRESGYELDPSWAFEVRPDNVDDLVAAFQAAYQDPALAQKGISARQFVEKHHNTPDFERQLSKFLSSVL